MSKINNPVNQEYINSFQKNLKARENISAYQNQKYKEYLQTLYPNYTPIEAVLNRDYENYRKLEDETENLIMSSQLENYKQQAKQNLETLLSVSNAQKVLDELTDDEMKHLNTFFSLMKTNLKSVKFYSTDEFVKYIKTFIKQQINDNTDVKLFTLSPDVLDVIEGETKTENEELRENLKTAQQQLKQNIINQLRRGVDEITTSNPTNKENIQKNYNGTKVLIVNISKYVSQQRIITEAQFEDDFQRAFETDRYNDSSTFNSLPDFNPKLNKTKKSKSKLTIPSGQSPRFYQALRERIMMFFLSYIEQQPRAVKAGTGMYKSYNKNRQVGLNPARRLIRNKNIKIGNGANHYIKNNFYIDMYAFNDNVLQVKYLKNGNKKLEVGMSDILKQNINELMNDKYNPNLFVKLNDSEKKIVSAVNDIFQFVDSSMFVGNPVDELFEKYNILVGQIEAGNDNPTMIKNLKLIAQELYKLKKINKSQIRNLFFNLESYSS